MPTDEETIQDQVYGYYKDWREIALTCQDMSEIWAYFRRWEREAPCEHTWEYRRRNWGQAKTQRLTRQCTKCHCLDNAGVKTPPLPLLMRYPFIIEVDQERQTYLRQYRETLKTDLQKKAEAIVRGRIDTAFAKYYQTPQWKAKRGLVIKRCHGICEGCGTRPAVDVHHISRLHQYDEFLFELIGLCRECHERIEGDK